MTRILLVHEDGLLRSRYRKLFERTGNLVSEASTVDVHDSLLAYDHVVTQLFPLADDVLHDPFLIPEEVFHGLYSSR